jgi:hypothetical protein
MQRQNMLQDYVRTGTYYAAIVQHREEFEARFPGILPPMHVKSLRLCMHTLHEVRARAHTSFKVYGVHTRGAHARTSFRQLNPKP